MDALVIKIPFDPVFYKSLKDDIVKRGADTLRQEMLEAKIPEFLVTVMLKKALKNGWGS